MEIIRTFNYKLENLHLSFRRTQPLLKYIKNSTVKNAIAVLKYAYQAGIKIGTRTKKPEKAIKLILSILINLQKGTSIKETEILCIGLAYLNKGRYFKRGIIIKARGAADKKKKRTVHLTLPIYIIKNEKSTT